MPSAARAACGAKTIAYEVRNGVQCSFCERTRATPEALAIEIRCERSVGHTGNHRGRVNRCGLHAAVWWENRGRHYP